MGRGSAGQMKPGSRRGFLAGAVAAAAVTAACAASPPTAWPPALHGHRAPDVACTTLPTASRPVVAANGQRSQLDMPPVPGGLVDVAALSSSSAVAVGATVPRPPHS